MKLFKKNFMDGICLQCNNKFTYIPSQSYGKFCSNRCQGDHHLDKRFQLGTRWNNAMSKYVKRIRGNTCESCGITNWNQKPLTLQVDHIDGNRKNNSLNNLKVLCPNCHSQTETFGHKNVTLEGKNKFVDIINKNRNSKKIEL